MAINAFDLNLRHLRAVLAVAEQGTVNAAAREISLSQPAVTQGIAGIESMLDVPLFERRPDGMIATAETKILAPRVRAAIAHMAAAMRAIRQAGAGFAHGEQLVTAAQLRALVAVAAEGSYVSAAQATGLSQPSLHRAVRDLERLCGAILIERRGRGVALTAAGHRLARAFRLAANEIEAALGDLAGLKGIGGGRITIGAMPLARARLLPCAIASFHRELPGVTLAVVEGSHTELIEQLRDGHLHLMVGALRDPSPGPDVVQAELMADSVAVMARSDHPLMGTDPTPVDLARYPWIVPPGRAPLREQWRRLFVGQEPPPAPIECGSVMVIRELLIESNFLTLLSPDQVALETRSGLLAPVMPLANSRRRIGMTTRADWRANEAQTRFVTFLRETGSSLTLP